MARYVLFLFLVARSIFIPNTPVFTPIFVNIFRAGAVLFMVFYASISMTAGWRRPIGLIWRRK